MNDKLELVTQQIRELIFSEFENRKVNSELNRSRFKELGEKHISENFHIKFKAEDIVKEDGSITVHVKPYVEYVTTCVKPHVEYVSTEIKLK